MENDKVEKAEEKVVGVDNTLTVRDSSTLMPSTNGFDYIEALANQMDNLTKIAKVFIKGSLCAAKNEADFAVATITGQQLNLPMMTSVNNIFSVQGKSALTTHLMRALLLRAGITFEKVHDYEPMFVYYEGEEDPDNKGKLRAKKIPFTDASGKVTQVPIPRGTATIADIDETKFAIGRTEVDRITTYKFKRKLKQADGSYEVMKVTSYFKMTDAVRAGLADKDNYRNYPARMLDARAYAIGSREIASDVLYGMYTVTEMADTYDVNYTIDEEYQESLVTDAQIVD